MQVIQRKLTPESSFVYYYFLFSDVLCLSFGFYQGTLKAHFWKKMWFKNSLGYLQSGLHNHPTMCCHITAVGSCSAYWWFALEFPFHSAANPLEVKDAVVGDFSLYYNRINKVSYLSPVWLQEFQLGWAWVTQEVLILGWQLWRLAGVVSLASGANICSSHCWDPAPPPAVKGRVRGSAPTTQVHTFRGQTGWHLCMALWSVGTNEDLETIFLQSPKYFLIYFTREETFLVCSVLSVLLRILCHLICWNFHSILHQHMLEDSKFLTFTNAASIS